MNWLIVLKMIFCANTLEIFIVYGLGLPSVFEPAAVADFDP